MKQIPLTQGKFTIVDDANYEWLNQYKWFAKKKGESFYAVRSIRMPNGKVVTAQIHRMILGLDYGDKGFSDHINHNSLDNRIENLRIATNSQNQHNQLPRKGCSSKYKGVYWDKKCKKWYGRIAFNRKRFSLGCFENEEEAAKAYNKAAIELFGEFALLNDVA